MSDSLASTLEPRRASVGPAEPQPGFLGLYDGFERAAAEGPDRPALVVGDETLTYAQLSLRARRLGALIHSLEAEQHSELVAFLATRSVHAYAAVLGILAAGRGYVPLHPDFPNERTARMLNLSGVGIVVVGREGLDRLADVLPQVERELTLVVPADAVDGLAARFARHRFVSEDEDVRPLDAGPSVTRDSTAYLLFTSGSTGLPKGVPISHGNVTSYVDYVRTLYEIEPTDRLSQMFDLTFDLSVHDMFVCWTAGACLFSVPAASLMAPAGFIRKNDLTVWFSVPSVIGFMQRFRMLKPGSLPSLRLSLFCGEPLLANMADAWLEAAPDSRLENLYGPTEATIAISRFPWTGSHGGPESLHGVVSIGRVFEGQAACIVDERGAEVPAGETGELCLSGSQVTTGYFNDPKKTRERFVELPGRPGQVWYRTGDLARRTDDGVMQYVGRLDQQVQVLGHRVELAEVGQAVREGSGSDSAIALAWPHGEPQVEAIYGVVATSNGIETRSILEHCKRCLPDYAVPRDIVGVEELPLNANGKVDRNAVARMVKEVLNAGH